MAEYKKNPSSRLPAAGSGGSPKKNGQDPERKRLVGLFLIPLIFFIVLQIFVFPNIDVKRITYSEFFQMVERNSQTGDIVSCEMVEEVIRGKLKDGTYFQVNIPPNDLELVPFLRKHLANFTVNPPQLFWRNLIYSVLPVLLLIGFFWFFVYRGVQQGGGKIFSFGKSRARLGEKMKINFKDVAGVEEAKEELQEIIEFLKDPQKFQRLGGRIPKGVLLMGPPGTGKTLLAKAVAGEANVPFFSISGSDFVEMFVGVGAARVRDLFEQGKKAAKASGRGAIIFIDEIDAVGRQRFAGGMGGGHDEREQTLNALLVEMDGFDTQAGVIIIGASNRPDVLDPALLRPGRFDRQVVVDRPDIKGREEILKVHVRAVKIDPAADLQRIARQTPGFSGADLANLVNEAALLSARRSKETVAQPELEESIERVAMGPERKSRVVPQKYREIVAIHESGHAILALLLTWSTNPLQKVSIIPRGPHALGYTFHPPAEDQYLHTEYEMLNEIIVALGGRVAEELMFNSITSGAYGDFQQATRQAENMICRLGMSRKLGTVILEDKEHLSQQTISVIDLEVKRVVEECYTRAKELLTAQKEKIVLLAKTLLEREVIDGQEVKELLGLAEISKPVSPILF